MEDNIKNKIENICNDFLKQFADENDSKLNDEADFNNSENNYQSNENN